MSSYISINSRNTLDSCRMGFLLLIFSHFSDFFHSFQGVFFDLDFLKIEKYPLKTVKNVTELQKTWRKRHIPINLQCIMRIYRYVGARMMHYNENYSKIKISKIPIVWVKISKTSTLDHIWSNMLYLDIFAKWCGIFEILILLSFLS